MSNLYLCPDDFWRCPIDLNHQVLAKRFQYHIRRCMIANPHIHRVRCVFNANHLTTPSDLLNHMSTCPDAIERSTVLIGLSDIPPGQPWSDDCHRSSTPTAWQMFHDVNATEDWDDDIRERQAKRAQMDEQVLIQSLVHSLASTPSLMQHSHEKSIACVASPVEYVEDAYDGGRENSYKLPSVVKQAHVFKEYDNDGQIHPVETDDITKDLMRIRTMQLIGGAGRGACCLLRMDPPILGRRAH